MAGHSHAKNIMHRKGKSDAARSKVFSKLAREITVAAKLGMPDPAFNARLRLAVANARSQSMPKDNIDRAIKKAIGSDGENYDEIRYEGYGPGGVAVIVETLTDNRNRTGPEIRSTFSKLGGSIAEPGSVAWQFERKGIIAVPASVDEDELMLAALDAGAEDVAAGGASWTVTCEPQLTSIVRHAIEEAGIAVESSDLTMIPTSLVELDSVDVVKPILKLIDALEEHDDVQDVYANFDIPDSLLAELED